MRLKSPPVTTVVLFVLLLLNDACLDRIDISIPTIPLTDLVVDGLITDLPGPYTIKLSSPINLDKTSVLGVPVSGAKVSISDNLGNVETLTEKLPGVYVTAENGMRGTVGRSYKLHLVTPSGTKVESTDEMMLPVGDMDSLYYQYEEKPNLNAAPTAGFRVFVDGKGLADNSNFIRWRFTGQYAVVTEPGYHREATGNCPECGCPAPPSCCGCALVNGTPHLGYQSPGPNRPPVFVIGLTCTCCNCWVTEHENRPIINSGKFVGSNKFPKVELAFVPITFYTFYDKYKVTAEQLSLTKTAFEYWQAIQTQKDGVGSLFQPVTGKFPTNLTDLAGKVTVRGIFSASAVKQKKIVLDRSLIHINLETPVNCDGRVGPMGESCIKAFPNSTSIRPADWD